MKNVLLFLIVVVIASSCQPKRAEPSPVYRPQLLITSISFPGIPDKDVTIDQRNRIIYVKMPALMETDKLNPTYKLSSDVWLSEATKSDIEQISYVNRWCSLEKEHLTIRIYSQYKNGGELDTVYTIKPLAAAPLEITHAVPLQPFAIGDSSGFVLNVQNLYGNSLPGSVIFTNKKTGAQLTSINNIAPFQLNKIKVWTYVPFEVGEYDVALTMPTGELFKLPQTLKVVKGRLNFSRSSPLSVLAGKTLTVTGENLFEGDAPFRLLAQDGEKVALNATYTLTGKTATLSVPASVKPGYYMVELLNQDGMVHSYHRLSVLRYEGQPTLETITYTSRGFMNLEPLILPRIQPIYVEFTGIRAVNYYSSGVVFKDESDEKKVFRFPFPTVPSSINFSIPETVPAGRYKAFIQEIDPETKAVLRESEPFERTIILR